MKSKINAGIIGASGYTGGELCRLLLNHKNIGEIYATSRENEEFERIHQNLLGSGLEFIKIEELEEKVKNLDIVFFCTPSGEAMRYAPKFLEHKVKVIDLSADFRFKDKERYREVYNRKHISPTLLEEAVYGVTELNRENIKKARLIANPGCYVITSILGIYPLIKENVIDLTIGINIHAINGTTGAGNKPKREILHAEAANNILPYSMEGHRHCPELEDQLGKIAGQRVLVNFNSAHGPFPRGIYSNISVLAKNDFRQHANREVLLDIYRDYYGMGSEKEYFVRINAFEKRGKNNEKEYDTYPNIVNVVGSNFCHIGLDYDSKRKIIKIISVTDNLVKGAAGSAIQNMNVIFGFNEGEGLKQYGF